jgi:hypothetical protein
MTQSRRVLQQILTETQKLRANGAGVLHVFDLDSTLFDVSPRIQQILYDFADLPEIQRQFPESVKILRTIKTQRNDWGIKQAVIRAGLDQEHPDFHEALKNFWLQHFFSNEYLEYDTPYEGAVPFVQKVHTFGSDIIYLTGRDTARMGIGSEKVLSKWKFPLGRQAQLILKPEKGMDDARFKSDWFLNVPKDQYGKLYFYENEPVNVHLVGAEHPHVDIVFFDSTHSGKAEAPTHHPTLKDFLMDEFKS